MARSTYLERQIISCWIAQHDATTHINSVGLGLIPGRRTGFADLSTHVHPASLPRVTDLPAFGCRTHPWNWTRVHRDSACRLGLIRSKTLQSGRACGADDAALRLLRLPHPLSRTH